MMKATKIPILLTLVFGALLGYIAAFSNQRPAAAMNAAPADNSEKAGAQGGQSAVRGKPNEQSQRRLLKVAQAPATTTLVLVAAGTAVGANGKKPNILVIWGDDIGYDNISAYNLGMMGYKTPNIDRIAREGALFTDF